MKYPNQDPPIPVHRGWAEHRAAKIEFLDRRFWEAHVLTVLKASDGVEYEAVHRVAPTTYRKEGSVKIERAKPDRIERRKMLKAERKSKKALKTHGSLGTVRTPFDKKADWPDLPNPNANRDKEWAKARREAKKAQKERAIQLRLAG